MKTEKLFEGTIAGKKFLFQADSTTLDKVADVPPGKTAEEIAETLGAQIIARSKANHEAVKTLMREWVKGQRANSPVWQAKAQTKAKAKEEAKALKARAKAELKEQKALAKAAKELEAKALVKQAVAELKK